MSSNNAAAYARFRDELRPKIHGFIYEAEHRLGFHHSGGGNRSDCCDPKQPHPPITDDWIYGRPAGELIDGLPADAKVLRTVLDYTEPEWTPIITVLTRMPGAIFLTAYFGSDLAEASQAISEAIKQLNRTSIN